MQEQQVPTTRIQESLLTKADVSLYIQREELVHPTLSGNKWYKLKYNILKAREEGYETLLTFGGAYSNHIYATAAAGKLFGFKTIGIIRGEQAQPLNETLRFAQDCGMQLQHLSREAFQHKNDPGMIAQLQDQWGRFYLLPEGGTNLLAVRGCEEMGRQAAHYDVVCVSVGTGGTLAGVAMAMKGQNRLLGFSALKNGQFLTEEIHRLMDAYKGTVYHNFQIIDQYHFGGYAKFKPALIDFINQFNQRHRILLDPVYTGKMMFGLYDMIRQGYFSEGSRLLVIHSGGLQGIQGFNERYKNKLCIYSE